MNELQFCTNQMPCSTYSEEGKGNVCTQKELVGDKDYGYAGKCDLKTIIVTFVWRDMTKKERNALNQGIKIFASRPFAILHPKSYPVNHLLSEYTQHKSLMTIALDDEHLSSIDSYNRMLLSPWFYKMFSQYDYMLIYQIDAYVFSDQLDYWTSLNYDYIGAPWMLNDKLYHRLIGQWITRMLQLRPIHDNHVHSYHLFHRVGNGGFSLRRIQKMAEIMEKNRELISSVKGKHERQEDVMISIILKEKEKLKIPDWKLAVFFSFEKAPGQCLEQTQGAFPFGCHDTNAKYWDSFWKYYISIE